MQGIKSEGILLSPTSVNETLSIENYISWESGVSNWNKDLIFCTKDHCSVVCELITNFCKYLTINASLSKTLYIRCSIDNACDYLTVSDGPSDNFTIRCIAKTACTYIDIHTSYTRNVDIECDKAVTSSSDTTCVFAKIYAEYSDTVNILSSKGSSTFADFYVNYTGVINAVFNEWASADYAQVMAEHAGELNIRCYEWLACADARFYCPIDGKCNVDCYGHDSCSNGAKIWLENRMYDRMTLNCTDTGGYTDSCEFLTIHCNDTIYGSQYSAKYETYIRYDVAIPGEWYCSPHYSSDTRYSCCPFKSELAAIECGTDDCVIDCSSMDCVNRKIDGLNANSVTVNCDGIDDCKTTRIQCPVSNGTLCTVNCNDYKSCQHITLQLNADQNSILNMQCIGNYSCFRTAIVYQDITSVDEINMHCVGNKSCIQTVFYIKPYNVKWINKLNMNCIGNQSCMDVTINVWSDIGMNELNMICDGAESCKEVIIETKLASNINNLFNLECNGYASCYDMEIDVYSSGINNISCMNELACFSTDSGILWIINNVKSDVRIICDSGGYSANQTGACYHPWYSSYSKPRLQIYHADDSRHMYDVSLFCNSWDCRNLYLYSDFANNLNIDCTLSYSCYSLNIPSNPNINALSINCNDNTGSCINANIECPAFNEHSCTISCNNGVDLCTDISISVPDNYRYNYLSLNCGEDSCDGITVECTEYSGSAMISRSSIVYKYNNVSTEYDCSSANITSCCPYLDTVEIEELNCDAYSNQICNVDCSWSATGDCKDILIDGTASSKLILNCTKYKECKDSAVICPNGGCDIYCSGNSSCHGLRVSYFGDNTDSASVSLFCNYFESCYHTYISAPNTDHISLQVSKDSSADYVILDGVNANTMNISIDAQSYNHYVIATNVNQFNLDCVGSRACDNCNYYVENAGTVRVRARGYRAFSYSDVHAENAGSMEIDCAGQSYPHSAACASGYYYVNEETTKLECYGSGCSELGYLYVKKNASLIDIRYNGCDYCDSLDDCIENDWDLRCPTSAPTSGVFTGRYCSGSYSCGCSWMDDTTQFIKNPNHPWCAVNGDTDFMYVPPTIDPTTEPTISPTTDEPTVFPTTAEPTASPTTADPSASPTTAAPSQSPTTAAPSQSPTTAAPTPITSPPTTAEPTTGAPTRSPITTAPTTANPTTSEPTSANPTTPDPSLSPTTAEPTVSPITSEPTRAPTTDEPTGSPITAEPTTSPTTDEPTVSSTTFEPATTVETITTTDTAVQNTVILASEVMDDGVLVMDYYLAVIFVLVILFFVNI